MPLDIHKLLLIMLITLHENNGETPYDNNNLPAMNKWQEFYKDNMQKELKGLIDVMLKKCNIKNKKGDDNASRSKNNADAYRSNNNVPPMSKSHEIMN